MIKAVLLDLDNTLLGNETDTFLPAYFSLCGDVARRHMPADEFLKTLLLASRAMIQNTDPALTNDEVFWTRFSELTNVDAAAMVADFDHFYRNGFEELRDLTVHSAAAARLMDSCFLRDLDVVIATNPMYPRIAIEARLTWAGVSTEVYDYRLVTTMENMHATKPHKEYYTEILDVVGCAPYEALMVGDDLERDIEPASSLGLFTYWITGDSARAPADIKPTAQGSLQDLVNLIDDDWLLTLEPALSPD